MWPGDNVCFLNLETGALQLWLTPRGYCTACQDILSRFRVQGSDFGFQGSGFRVLGAGSGFRVQGPGFREVIWQIAGSELPERVFSDHPIGLIL